jgi:hypothetical protein
MQQAICIIQALRCHNIKHNLNVHDTNSHSTRTLQPSTQTFHNSAKRRHPLKNNYTKLSDRGAWKPPMEQWRAALTQKPSLCGRNKARSSSRQWAAIIHSDNSRNPPPNFFGIRAPLRISRGLSPLQQRVGVWTYSLTCSRGFSCFKFFRCLSCLFNLVDSCGYF